VIGSVMGSAIGTVSGAREARAVERCPRGR
jgi:hypothetical protein